MGQPISRMTPQRRIIYEELKRVHSHPCADEIYEMVRKKLPRISLGTVYRNLEILTACGLIQKLEWAGTQKRFDGNIEEHHHVRCVKCGKVEDLPIDLLPGLRDLLQGVNSYEILGHRIEIIGVCPRCRETPRSQERIGNRKGKEA